ncbi:MAG: pyruvate ferredoxin oxidoreductase [Candidatus Omnitrophica bacterium]|nr:pyruvate ferredoxin oxidoreductase [Candidatus Omnitrophota bacterium]MBU4488796.1 pyruvate ferredoxin oxidoreductase [Candidatus Omnitrophota bacterium]MCG2705453.1 pyruvate ferredoxin oxidoreductase [Candidatus Omnitrophota bacterium]
MKQIEPDVIAAYPITPQTEIVMGFSQYVADGRVKTEMIPVESEHSAMSACVGAAAAGARTMTATSANGLALMWEVVYIAASTRLPIIMPVVNRALSGPINIHCDHSDSMGARDSGWIQIYCENAQEVYESIILAVRIAEHSDILLPVMVCQDGFITSHAMEGMQIFDDKVVKDFIGEYKPRFSLLDVDRPSTVGPLDLQDFYFEHKRQQSDAMKGSLKIIPGIFGEFEKVFGKKHNFVDGYMLEDAEVAICALSSTAGTTRGVVDKLRKEGHKVGLLKPRFFRPFPKDAIIKSLSNIKALAVLDRSESFSAEGGPLFSEMKAAFYAEKNRPLIANYIYGLGGRDMFEADIEGIFRDVLRAAKSGKVKEEVQFIGVRE